MALTAVAVHAQAPPPTAKSAPPGFAVSAVLLTDRTLYWQGRPRAAIVFIAKGGDGVYVLAPASVQAFRRFLIGIGFEQNAAASFAERPQFRPDETECLAIAAAPLTCAEVSLRPKDGDLLELVTSAAKAREAPDLLSDQYTLLGATYLAVSGNRLPGTATTEATSSASGSMLLRGIGSKADRRIEYDLGAQYTRLQGSPPPALVPNAIQAKELTVQLNLFAASVAVDDDGARAYGGLFRAASPTDLLSGNALYFFSRPSVVGIAYKSAGEAFGSAAQRRRVRIQLTSPSLVRILWNGVQLAEAQLGPGDQFVPFTGFTDGFVDVVIRDASGRETRVRAEALPDVDSSLAALAAQRFGPHFYYLDAGRVLRTSNTLASGIGFANDDQVTAAYTYSGSERFVVQAALQTVASLARLGLAVGDASGQYRLAVNLGTRNELGLFASASPRWDGLLRLGVTGTWYTPPERDEPADLGTCIRPGYSACYSIARYQSVNVNLGYGNFPFSLGYLNSRSGRSRSQLALMQGAFAVPALGRGASLIALGSYSPEGGNYSVAMTLVVPLDFATNSSVTSTGSYDSGGQIAISAGLSTGFSEDQYDYMRSFSLSATHANGGTSGQRTSLSSNLQLQLGPLNNNLAVAGDASGAISGFASTNTMYALTGAGLAFNRTTTELSLIDPFSPGGQAGVAIYNRSREPQNVIAGGRSATVPPYSNLLLPVPQGLLNETVVAPGPALNEDALGRPVYLFKGNVHRVVVAQGLWVTARFAARPSEDSEDGRLRPEFTYVKEGEKIERVYPDASGRVLLFETLFGEPRIERFVIAAGSGRIYSCVAPTPAEPAAEDYNYPEVVYRCAPVARATTAQRSD